MFVCDCSRSHVCASMIEYRRTPSRGDDTLLVCSFGVGDALSTETTERMGNTLSPPSKSASCGGFGWNACAEKDSAGVWSAFRSCWPDSAGLSPSGDDIWRRGNISSMEYGQTITAFVKDFYQSRDQFVIRIAGEKQWIWGPALVRAIRTKRNWGITGKTRQNT